MFNNFIVFWYLALFTFQLSKFQSWLDCLGINVFQYFFIFVFLCYMQPLDTDTELPPRKGGGGRPTLLVSPAEK